MDDLNAKIAPTAAIPGFNVEGGSVFTNFFKAYKNKQLFLLKTGALVYEEPKTEPALFTVFDWCSDLTFSDINNSSLIGYAGRCVEMFLVGYDNLVASGAQTAYYYSEGEYILTAGISAVFVEQQNVFEGQFHSNTDNFGYRYWDDGRKSMPNIIWEDHDEGDLNPNAATSSVSGFGEMTWMSVEEVAQLFNTSVNEFTPETFKQVYLSTWIKDHEEEAATDNPNPLPELEIIEQVKNETNYVDDTATTTPAQPDSTATEGDNASNAANPVVEEDGSLEVEGNLRLLLQGSYRPLSVSLVFKSTYGALRFQTTQ